MVQHDVIYEQQNCRYSLRIRVYISFNNIKWWNLNEGDIFAGVNFESWQYTNQGKCIDFVFD
jgi:hypothetical protein